MSSWFFNNLSLKFLATVRTVQVLWGLSKIEADATEYFNDVYEEGDTSKLSLTTFFHFVVQKFDNFIDLFMLPQSIKDDLSFFFCQMYPPLIATWRAVFDIVVREDHLKHPMLVKQIFQIINNIVWDDIGCMDPKKSLELQLSNQESISYTIWTHLCRVCSEEYMRKFSDRVDWRGSTFDSTITIFWYNKIYHSYPTESMFASPQDFLEFQNHLKAKIDEGNDINRILFKESVLSDSLAAVKYFWNKLTDAQRLELSAEESFFNTKSVSTAVYLLGVINFNYLPGNATDCGTWQCLLSWPWVMFVDSWIDKCKIMDKSQFAEMFRTLVVQRKNEQHSGIEEFTKRQARDHLHARYYVPCEKLWKFYRDKFGALDEAASKIMVLIFGSEDIQMCRIILKESPSAWRRDCLVAVGNCCQIISSHVSPSILPNRDFRDKFMEVILADDEEREMFREITHEVYNQ